MIKRKLTIRPKKISKSQEDEYWEKRTNELRERKINAYYEDNKYKLTFVIIFTSIISSPFIAIKGAYNYIRKAKNTSIHPEKNE